MGGDWSWLTGWFEMEEKPPEALVLGAELRCPYGSKHTFLMVGTDHIDINNLPKACVDDCKKSLNIEPFGQCYGGSPCECDMELESKWENPEPQNELINGKEIITTKSVLLCKARGMEIQAVTSGQEGVMAARWALYGEIENQFPGLLAILLDPYGSLYLNEGMYEIAITFLLDRIVKNGGEIFLPSIYGKDDPEGELIRAALERLLPDCDASACDRLINGLENTGYLTGMDEVKGWDVNSLNLQMIVMLRKDCAATDKKIKTDPFARWAEENKVFTSSMADVMTQLAYATVLCRYMTSSSTTEEREKSGAKGKKSKGKKPELSGKWENVNENMSDFSRAYQKQVTGEEGKAWVQNGVKFDGMKDGVLLEAKGKYAQFINRKTGQFYSWFTGERELINEAWRQINASEGAKIEWHFAEEESLNVVKDLFSEEGITEIDFIFDPPK